MGEDSKAPSGPFRSESVSAADERTDRDRIVEKLIARVEELLALQSLDTQGGHVGVSRQLPAEAGKPTRDHPGHAPPDPKGFPEGRAAFARHLLRQRRARGAYLPETLFGEPAWDMMLDLYAAHYEGKSVPVSSLCIAAHVPSTTALRTIESMSNEGCLVRRRDPTDGRRIFVALSDTARSRIDAYFDEFLFVPGLSAEL